MIISISGPSKSGKSTIISLLKDSLPRNTIYIPDIYNNVWVDMVNNGFFSKFEEVTKDRDYLFLYIARVCESYDSILDKYLLSDDLVILENCYLDYLIYAQLNSWYHYPLVEYQESKVSNLLNRNYLINRIYMTTADDSNYSDLKVNFDYKVTKTSFKRNRKLELAFYNIYRNNRKVVSLPPNSMECDKVIIDDLNENFEITNLSSKGLIV